MAQNNVVIYADNLNVRQETFPGSTQRVSLEDEGGRIMFWLKNILVGSEGAAYLEITAPIAYNVVAEVEDGRDNVITEDIRTVRLRLYPKE